jgi:hypothetical protein
MSRSTHEVNITRLIDEGPITRFQIGIIVCCALVNLFDGMDTQSIGVAAPFIAEGLGVKIANFGPIFSSALMGATIGRGLVWSACRSSGPQDAADDRNRIHRYLHDPDRHGKFRPPC